MKYSGRIVILIFVLCVYCAFSNTWIAKDINLWQLRVMGGTKIFPALTVCLMAIPPSLLLLAAKVLLERKNKESGNK
ncbi:MAG: hypothetical protein ACOVSW_15325 [Candidatus Kapaibacteriota bacterium]